MARKMSAGRVLGKMVVGVAKAIDRANKDAARREKAAERETNRLLREQQKMYNQQLREDQKRINEQRKAFEKNAKEQEKRMQALAKEADRIKKLEEKEIRARAKQEEIEEKKLFKEAKENLSLDTIRLFGLGRVSEPTVKKIKYDLEHEAKIVSDRKEDIKEKLLKRRETFDDFVWSGELNSVVGPTGLIGLREVIASWTDEKIQAFQDGSIEETQEFFKTLHATGVYWSKDIDSKKHEFRWLSAYRLLAKSSFEKFELVIDNREVDTLLRERQFQLVKITENDLEYLRSYLFEFKLGFIQNLKKYIIRKSEIKLIG